ncbi:hypothetical protein GCM10022256_22840 [Frondihabitans peucedani]|uniref:Uncharacterized protein n=1 Tax=Frondihabitans peucedani TaxID=598626 RepID=A0ABP8E3E4_9MICO
MVQEVSVGGCRKAPTCFVAVVNVIEVRRDSIAILHRTRRPGLLLLLVFLVRLVRYDVRNR